MNKDIQQLVVRGGSWDYFQRSARCAGRSRYIPVYFGHHIGFRVVTKDNRPRVVDYGTVIKGDTLMTKIVNGTKLEIRAQELLEELSALVYLITAENAENKFPEVPEVVQVPAGTFIMGSAADDPDAYSDEKPQHPVYLGTYAISKYPVTNAQYKIFVDATGHRAPVHWQDGQILNNKENHPVVNVNRYDADAYCQWLSEKTGATYRLPTEQEWEKAARGIDGRKYPWGNDAPTKDTCNFNMHVGDTTPVDQYPAGKSPYGVMDMAGNVWEWTNSIYAEH